MEVASKGPIRVTFPVGEAAYALDAISIASAKAWEVVRRMTTTQAPAHEREIAEMAAVYLDRAHKRLDGALYPVCRFLQADDCTLPVVRHDERGVPYCSVHYALVQGIREAVE
jgi:hypothetical protein